MNKNIKTVIFIFFGIFLMFAAIIGLSLMNLQNTTIEQIIGEILILLSGVGLGIGIGIENKAK